MKHPETRGWWFRVKRGIWRALNATSLDAKAEMEIRTDVRRRLAEGAWRGVLRTLPPLPAGTKARLIAGLHGLEALWLEHAERQSNPFIARAMREEQRALLAEIRAAITECAREGEAEPRSAEPSGTD